MATRGRPQKQRKDDMVLHGKREKAEIVTDMIVGRFDAEATKMENKWGIDRLPRLQSAEVAQRWGEVMADMNDAIARADSEATAVQVNAAIKGLAIMDAAATAAGHQPFDTDAMEFHLGEFKFAILRDDRQWPEFKRRHPELMVYSLREVACILRDHASRVPLGLVKDQFPGAQVVDVRVQSPLAEKLDDEIPF